MLAESESPCYAKLDEIERTKNTGTHFRLYFPVVEKTYKILDHVFYFIQTLVSSVNTHKILDQVFVIFYTNSCVFCRYLEYQQSVLPWYEISVPVWYSNQFRFKIIITILWKGMHAKFCSQIRWYQRINFEGVGGGRYPYKIISHSMKTTEIKQRLLPTCFRGLHPKLWPWRLLSEGAVHGQCTQCTNLLVCHTQWLGDPRVTCHWSCPLWYVFLSNTE